MEKLLITQIIFSLLFTLSVLLQKKSTGFSGALAGAYADNTSFYGNKRGFAKFLENASIVLGFLMCGNAFVYIFF